MKKRMAVILTTLSAVVCAVGCANGHDAPAIAPDGVSDFTEVVATAETTETDSASDNETENPDLEGCGTDTDTYTDTADIDTADCFIVHTVGSRDITVMGVSDGKEWDSVNTLDLADDDKLGEWIDGGCYEICEYSYLFYGTTSPEHWYAIRFKDCEECSEKDDGCCCCDTEETEETEEVNTDDCTCRITLAGSCITDITYGNDYFAGDEYDTAHGMFLLTRDGDVKFVDLTMMTDDSPVTELEEGLD